MMSKLSLMHLLSINLPQCLKWQSLMMRKRLIQWYFLRLKTWLYLLQHWFQFYCCIILVRIVHPPMKTDPPAQPSPTQSILASFETNSGRWWIKLFKNQWIRFGCQFSQIEIQLNWPIQWRQGVVTAGDLRLSPFIVHHCWPQPNPTNTAVKIEVIHGQWKLLIFFTHQGRNKFRFDPQTNSTRPMDRPSSGFVVSNP